MNIENEGPSKSCMMSGSPPPPEVLNVEILDQPATADIQETSSMINFVRDTAVTEDRCSNERSSPELFTMFGSPPPDSLIKRESDSDSSEFSDSLQLYRHPDNRRNLLIDLP